ncbi:MAG: hypothetical protein FD138_2503, partial [Planctomycetota bacterium]
RLQFRENFPATFDLGIRAEEMDVITTNHHLDADRITDFAEVSVAFSKQGADEVLAFETDSGF